MGWAFLFAEGGVEFMAGAGREILAGRLMGWREGGFNFGESCDFTALHLEI